MVQPKNPWRGVGLRQSDEATPDGGGVTTLGDRRQAASGLRPPLAEVWQLIPFARQAPVRTANTLPVLTLFEIGRPSTMAKVGRAV
jgi:hypothetical protein